MPFFGPSFAGRSNSTTGTLTLTRCAAICAPITPAPSTATFLTWKRFMLAGLSLLAAGSAPPRLSCSLYISFLLLFPPPLGKGVISSRQRLLRLHQHFAARARGAHQHRRLREQLGEIEARGLQLRLVERVRIAGRDL